mgnify:CR=1 FL=1
MSEENSSEETQFEGIDIRATFNEDDDSFDENNESTEVHRKHVEKRKTILI